VRLPAPATPPAARRMGIPYGAPDDPGTVQALVNRIVAQSDERAKAHPHGGDIAALERWRDDMLVAVLKARESPGS